MLALALGLAGGALGIQALPDGAWLLLVLAVDVAHVHATWFRTYLDGAELKRRPWRYALAPCLAYALGVWAYAHGALTFWRALAYLAVFHFVRQQVGWVALYRARAGAANGRWERVVDEAAVYAATLYPLLVWHTQPQKEFSWFVTGDFVALSAGPWLSFAEAVWLAALGIFFGRELWRAVRQRRLALGKALVVASTALTWHVGIVEAQSDFLFTATNVIPHGVPYAWLLFAYTRERAYEAPRWSAGHVAAAGFAAFTAVLVGFAFCEQWAWDRFVEHDRGWLFGEGPLLSPALLAWLVPLLALPQATHYLLDAVLWRRGEARELPALGRALGSARRTEVGFVADLARTGEEMVR
ncbi:MAG: hypothetical protein QM756_01070 [Polyangiaceae bacterium]